MAASGQKKASAEKKARVRALLRRHGETFADRLGIDLARETPSQLFRWFCASLLFSARIGNRLALRAAQAAA